MSASNAGNGGGNPPPPPPAAPQISYGSPGATSAQLSFTTHQPVSLTPTNTGGAATTWTISPALSAGLSFNTSSGAITGTPTSAFAPTNFTVTATNAGGSGHFTLGLRADAALLNLGTKCFRDTSGAFQQGAIALSSTHVLALDCGEGAQHWVLWNYSTGALVAQGNSCPIDTCSGRYPGGLAPNIALAGQIAVVPAVSTGPSGFQVISVTDGSVLATVISAPPSVSVGNWQVASDGSYICAPAADGSSLTIWAPDGSVITTIPGNYTSADLFCAPGQVQVAHGPKGTNVIETLSIPGGASSVSPGFAGTFKSWFSDGSAFLSVVDNTVWVYSPTAVQQDFRTLPTVSAIAGRGPWFWAADSASLNVYKVGSSATPAATFTGSGGSISSVTPSGSTIAFSTPDGLLHIVDLSIATPAETVYSSPVGTVYAAVSASDWVIGGSDNGTVLDGQSLATTPRYFGYGRVLGLAGSASRFAVATSIGKVLIYKSSDLSLETTLDISAQQLSMSGDGTLLAVRTWDATQASVATISLPAGTVVNTWSYPNAGGVTPLDISLSNSGALLAQALSNGRQVTASSGGPVLWSDQVSAESGISPIALSLDDTLIAVSNGDNSSTIYLNDQPASLIPGQAIGWLQGNELYANASPGPNPGPGEIFNSAGIKQTAPNLPALPGPIQVLSAEAIFDPVRSVIYSLETGEAIWPAPPDAAGRGAVAGSVVVFPTFSNQIVVEPY